MDKRTYLVERGLAKPGRGRFSAEATAALAEAVAQGVVFDAPKVAAKRESNGGVPSDDGAPHRRSNSSGSSGVPGIPVKVQQRPQVTLFMVKDNVRAAFSACFKCAYPNSYCDCKDGPQGIKGWKVLDATAALV
jgi:hypothetical protein